MGDKGQTTPDLLIGVGLFLLAATLILTQGGGLFFPSDFSATTSMHTSNRVGEQLLQQGLSGGGEEITKEKTIKVLNEIETNDSYMEDEYGEDVDINMKVIVLEDGNTTQETDRRKPPMFSSSTASSNDYTVSKENGRYIAEAETDGFERGTTTRTKTWMNGNRVTIKVTT